MDIPFPRTIHDRLLALGLAEEHRWVPNSGWVTFRIRNEEDLDHALWLMRLSYLRYALKRVPDPRNLLTQESEELRLIHGAAGGVGSFAVQLAKWKGAHVIGTASAKNQASLRELGVDEPIDYRKTQFEEVVHDVDVVLHGRC